MYLPRFFIGLFGLCMSFDWLERLTKGFFAGLQHIENHHKIITNIAITITGLVCDWRTAKCTQQRPESDLSKSASFAG